MILFFPTSSKARRTAHWQDRICLQCPGCGLGMAYLLIWRCSTTNMVISWCRSATQNTQMISLGARNRGATILCWSKSSLPTWLRMIVPELDAFGFRWLGTWVITKTYHQDNNTRNTRRERVVSCHVMSCHVMSCHWSATSSSSRGYWIHVVSFQEQNLSSDLHQTAILNVIPTMGSTRCCVVSQKCEFEFSRILNLCGFFARAELIVSLKAPLHQTGAIWRCVRQWGGWGGCPSQEALPIAYCVEVITAGDRYRADVKYNECWWKNKKSSSSTKHEPAGGVGSQ